MKIHIINRSTAAAYGSQPAIEAREAAISAAQAEQARRAACFDDLLAALRDMCGIWVSVCNSQGWEPDHMQQYTRARAAIARATKEPT